MFHRGKTLRAGIVAWLIIVARGSFVFGMDLASKEPGSSSKKDLRWLATKIDNTFLRDLVADPEQEQHSPNKIRREVTSGHYVMVKPTPLPHPVLVAYSKDMAGTLGLSEEECKSEAFAQFFGGNIEAIPGFVSWATPYALSIYGQVFSACTQA